MTNVNLNSDINALFSKMNASQKTATVNKLLSTLTDTLSDVRSDIFEAVYKLEVNRINRVYDDRETINIIRNFAGNQNIASVNIDFDIKQLGRLSLNVDCTKNTDNVFINKIGGGYNKPALVFTASDFNPTEIAAFVSQGITQIQSAIAVK